MDVSEPHQPTDKEDHVPIDTSSSRDEEKEEEQASDLPKGESKEEKMEEFDASKLDPGQLAAHIAQLEKELGLDINSDNDDAEDEDLKGESAEVAAVPPATTKSAAGGAARDGKKKPPAAAPPKKKSATGKKSVANAAAAAATHASYSDRNERRAMKKQLDEEVDRFVKEMENWRGTRSEKDSHSAAAAAAASSSDLTSSREDAIALIPPLSSRHTSSSSRSKIPPRSRPLLFSEIVKATLGPGRLDASPDTLASALASVTTIEYTNSGLRDLDAFDCLPGVTKAYLGDNHLSSLDGVELWLGVAVLVLHDNDIDSLTPLFALRNLRVLDVRRNCLREIDAAVLPEKLETIDVAGNADLPAAGCGASSAQAKQELWELVSARCPELKSIDVVGTREQVAAQQQQDEVEGKEKVVDPLLEAENFGGYIAKKKERETAAAAAAASAASGGCGDQFHKSDKRSNGDDEQEDEDPLLSGSSPKQSSSDEVADSVLCAFGAQNEAARKLLASVLSHDEDGNDFSAQAEYDDDEDAMEQKDAVDVIKRAMSSKSLEVRLTDADFQDAVHMGGGGGGGGHHQGAAATSSARPSSARILRPTSARGGASTSASASAGTASARPGSARLFRSSFNNESSFSPSQSKQQKQQQREREQDEEGENDVRLSLPVAGGVNSQVRSVTDDLLRQYDHNICKRTALRKYQQSRGGGDQVEEEEGGGGGGGDILVVDHDDAAANVAQQGDDLVDDSEEKAAKNKKSVKKSSNHKNNDSFGQDVEDDDDEDADDDENNAESGDKNQNQNQHEQPELIYRDSNLDQEDPYFTEQLREESRGLRKELLFAAQHQRRVAEMRVDDIWDESMKELASISVNRAATSSLPGAAKHSASYEEALKVLAKSAHTSVEGLSQFRKDAKKE